MQTPLIERHLAAIVAADVVGYSRLMGADEKGTLLALRAHRSQLIDPLVAAHNGRIVKTTGDGLLLSFASVVEAVSCALAIQSGMAKRNAGAPAGRRIDFRVGINIGDVIFDKGDVFGDGVNIAARLEQIAPSGGICLSEDAYRQIRGKLDLAVVDAGEQNLKNIASPIRVFRIEPAAAAAFEAPEPVTARPRWRAAAISAAGLSLALVVAAVIGASLLREHSEPSRRPEPTSPPVAASPLPVIAVLPFANQTGDDAQEYFADGVTEEVTNALGRFNTLRVIGRNAVLRFKRQAPTQEEISSELGAHYLVAGTVRRSGSRVRIAAQLTEARAGTLMWSDRYDGELTDIFEFQDTIARQIAGTLAANIAQVEARRRLDHPRPNPTAFDLVLRARAIGHGASRTENRRARELLAKAIELDPNYAAAHALLSEALRSLVILGWTEFPDQDLARAVAEAQKAIARGPDEPDGYRALGASLVVRADYDQAQGALRRAIEINPSDAGALATWGGVLSFSGDLDGGINALQLALKLDPTLEPSHIFDLAIACYLAGRYEDALRFAERGLARYPDFPMLNVPAAAAAARLGHKDRAARYAETLRRRVPFLDLDALGSRFKDAAHAAQLREGVKAAGF